MEDRHAGSVEGRRPEAGRGAAGRGFSLVELVIAMAVASVGLLLAAGVLIQAHAMLGQSAVYARSPVVDLALLRLRADLRGAAAVDRGPGAGGAVPGSWSRDRLVLSGADGSAVLYENSGGRLVRAVAGPGTNGGTGGGEDGPEARAAFGGITSWRWRERAPGLVTVEIVYDRPGAGRGRIVDPAQRGPGRAVRKEIRMTVALRGGGLGWGW